MRWKLLETYDGLVWSDVFFLEESNHLDLDLEYLYFSHSDLSQFVIIEEEMKDLNDYCVLCLSSVKDKRKKLDQELRDFKAGKSNVIVPEEFREFYDPQDVVMGLEKFEIPKWDYIQRSMSKSMCVILVFSFLEKSLKSLCVAYKDNQVELRISKIEKIGAYIKYLKDECNINFAIEVESLDLINRYKKIRNAFAHGDWDYVDKYTYDFSLSELFATISEIFSSIEKACEGKFNVNT